jgi:hypothetical protein
MIRLHRFLLAVTLALGVACDLPLCSPTDADPACSDAGQTPTYVLLLNNAPADLAALVISLDAGTEKITVQLSVDGNVRAKTLASNAGETSWRAVMLGRIPISRIATIVLTSPSDVTPTATVIEAAAGSTGGYATIAASQVQVQILRIN